MAEPEAVQNDQHITINARVHFVASVVQSELAASNLTTRTLHKASETFYPPISTFFACGLAGDRQIKAKTLIT